MNTFVKWIMIMSICTIFALDSIVLLSLQAGSAAGYTESAASSTPHLTSDCMRLDSQSTDQSTNNSTGWSWKPSESGNASIQNPAHDM